MWYYPHHSMTLRHAPLPIMEGPTPPVWFHGNGMGTTQTRWLVHALLWFADDLNLDIWAARWHDWAYRIGKTDDDRQRADEWLWVNIRECIRCFWTGRKRWKRIFLARPVAWACYRAVRDFGAAAFGKE